YREVGMTPPDVDDPEQLKQFFAAIQCLAGAGRLLAYHDRSDGGLLATLAEMAFAGRVGLDVTLDALGDDAIAALFAEELGAVVQVDADDSVAVAAELQAAGLAAHDIGRVTTTQRIVIRHDDKPLFESDRMTLQRQWAKTSYTIQALRDAPDCARQEYDSLLDTNDPGLPAHASFDMSEDVSAPYLNM